MFFMWTRFLSDLGFLSHNHGHIYSMMVSNECKLLLVYSSETLLTFLTFFCGTCQNLLVEECLYSYNGVVHNLENLSACAVIRALHRSRHKKWHKEKGVLSDKYKSNKVCWNIFSGVSKPAGCKQMHFLTFL